MTQFNKELVSFIRETFSSEGFIPLHAPHFSGHEKEYVLETIDSTFVSTVGSYVNKFEDMVSSFTGAKHAIATMNGTAALHIALILVDVQSNDEVITQSLTFVATANAIRYCGAEPVFIDVERSTLGMSPDSLKEFLADYAEVRDDGLCWNKRTERIIRACVPMHNLGHPVRIKEIKKICDEYNIELVEDAAESLGSRHDDIHTGCTGKISAISFNGNKIITSGGGGMIITNDALIAKRAKHITTTAKTPHPWLFIHSEVGYNYRLPNLNAALGCAQMEVLPDYLERKRVLATQYNEWFLDKDYDFFLEPIGSRSNYWFNAFFSSGKNERDKILEYTNNQKVMTRPVWTPLDSLDMFKRNLKVDLVNTRWIEERLICIPSSVIL
ncbi:Bacillosamine/Legionaminic acid biosynthesis aminotransferase PglE; 4-keto-6-deoxy-N-Acetyl-D-hexosaminyl-(Lipid carrier) aminotransferase [hydrothermal vent metagenome]|uniref:Bacillosamine/Legionaminic acid biosynthesis aminotransferase PglE 4-keto-6-deoxy-N-Acetyl-D-hexosaminyl-(Lipid carrier) aminotransferase n=1 Tax=hydrothermal vent metagenome TaxID=652676 RepID=A0A3B0Y9T7_9ZZZZ